MLPHLFDRTPGWPLLLAGALLGLAGPAVRAADTKDTPVAAEKPAIKKTSALARVPADAAFFATFLRNKEQLDLLTRSKAYKVLVKSPLVQMALKQALAALSEEGSPLEAIKKLIEDKENKELLGLLVGALHDEVFLYGGKGWVDLLNLYSKINGASQFSAGELFLGKPGAEFAGMRAYLRCAQKNRELLHVPTLVVGFKLKEPKKVVAQLERLEKFLTKQLEDNDKLKDKLKRKGNFLTIQVDGGLLPLDDNPLAAFEENKDEFAELLKHLKKMTLAVSVGIKDDYLLVGLGSSLANVEKLGDKGKTLAGRKELELLDGLASKKVTSVTWYSGELRTALSSDRDLDEMASGFKRLMEKTSLKDERKKALVEDVEEACKELKKLYPPQGAHLGVSFLTGDGYESFGWDFGKHDRLKGINTKLVNHLGGKPIFAAAFGYNVDGSTYTWFRKWAMKTFEHGEAAFLDTADDDAKATYKKIKTEFLPLVEQLDSATRKLLIPSLKESGLGIVIDGKWTSKQWHKGLPSGGKALPMLEVGLLVGTTDGNKFASAMKEYRTTLNELYEKIRSTEGVPSKENLQEFKLEAPDKEKGKNGTLYSWKVPEDSGLDKQFVPTGGTGKDVAVLTLSKAHTERLLASTKLEAKGLPRRDLVGVMVLDFPALVDAALPWVDVALNTLITVPGDDEEAAKKVKEMATTWSKQARELAPVARCFKGLTSASYLEGGKLVTRTRITFRDLEEKPAAPPKPKD